MRRRYRRVHGCIRVALGRVFQLYVIASGSKGNAALVKDMSTGEAVAIDCGVCARDFTDGCAEAGVDPRNIRAMFITHEHSDHTKGLGVVLRRMAKLGADFPIYAERSVMDASWAICGLRDDFDFQAMKLGKWLHFGDVGVLPFPTIHDSVSSCGFRIEGSGDALGYMTDTGIVTPDAHDALQQVRVLAIESNHDVAMLKNGPYPAWLKARIASEGGHLSNVQAAEELDALLWPGLEQVVAMHISENNNTYLLPPKELKQVVGDGEGTPQVRSAYQHRPVTVS